MKAIVAKKCRFSSMFEQREVKIPEINHNELLIKVCAVGVNRDDIIDVDTSVDDGFCPGLECSGIIEAVGRNVNCWKVGERVCAILEGGGYAEQVAVPADFVLPLPDDIDLDDAAAGLPYASCCIWLALYKRRTPETLEDEETILIREGSNGISPLAVQYAKYMGFKVIASTGNRDSLIIYDYYGADFCVVHTQGNFITEVWKKSGYLGVDLVLDYGASDLERNMECCCAEGRVAIVALDGVKYIRVDLARQQEKQFTFKVVDLRSKDFRYKASVIAGLKTHLWPAILHKKVVPAIDHYFPASETQKALDLLKKNDAIGKIIVRMDFDNAGRHLKMQ